MNTTQIFNMKYLITESQLDKAYFKYLDYLMNDIELNETIFDEKYKVYYTNGIRTFTYSIRTKDVYIFSMFVEEFKDMFGNLDSEEALEIIGKWIENKFGYPVRDVISVDTMSA